MNNLEKEVKKPIKRTDLRNYVAGGLTTAFILTTSLTGCDYIEGINNPPTTTSGAILEPSPTFSPESTATPSPEPTSTPIPTPTEIPPTPTPERAKPSVIVRRGDTSKAEIAFTFDDSGAGLHKILNICNEKGIKATFFLLAGELESCPDIWRQAVKDGHQICSHGAIHAYDLGTWSEEKIRENILKWERICKNTLGEEYLIRMKKDFPYFRSPGGNRTARLQQVLGDLGYPITAYWSREDCWFWDNNPNNYTIVENYVLNAKNGDIFLAHGGTAGSVAEIIDKTEDRGYTFKLLSEILD